MKDTFNFPEPWTEKNVYNNTSVNFSFVFYINVVFWKEFTYYDNNNKSPSSQNSPEIEIFVSNNY